MPIGARILGADTLLLETEDLPSHWQLLPFGAIKVADFLASIDFFVYFTHPLWRESFGRAIAEAIAAGKLVITDPATAEAFGPGVIAERATRLTGSSQSISPIPADMRRRCAALRPTWPAIIVQSLSWPAC